MLQILETVGKAKNVEAKQRGVERVYDPKISRWNTMVDNIGGG